MNSRRKERKKKQDSKSGISMLQVSYRILCNIVYDTLKWKGLRVPHFPKLCLTYSSSLISLKMMEISLIGDQGVEPDFYFHSHKSLLFLCIFSYTSACSGPIFCGVQALKDVFMTATKLQNSLASFSLIVISFKLSALLCHQRQRLETLRKVRCNNKNIDICIKLM